MDKHKTTAVVATVESSLSVHLVMPMLENIDDHMLRKEIAEEAVRLSIVERLGGFQEVTVREAVAKKSSGAASRFQYVANINFDELSNSIQALQQEFDRVSGLAHSIAAVVSALPESEDGTVVLDREVLTTLRGAVQQLHAPQQDVPPLVSQPEEGISQEAQRTKELEEERKGYRSLLSAADEDSDDDCACTAPDDPEAAGYTRME